MSNNEKIDNMKDKLIHIKDNLYIHPNDPQYHEKLLKYMNSNNADSHYFLGMKYERLGRIKKAISHYQKAIILGSKHKDLAEENLVALKQPSKEGEHTDRTKVSHLSLLAKSTIIFLVLFNIVLILLLLTLRDNSEIVEIEKVDEIKVEVPPFETIEQLEAHFYNEVLDKAAEVGFSSFTVKGMMNDKSIIQANYDSTKNPLVNISYLDQSLYSDKLNEMKQTIIAANLVRTALQSYIHTYDKPPEELSMLISDYPNNYLSFIPKEKYSNSNTVSDTLNYDGGWIYNRNASTIEEMFYPNYYNRGNDLSYDVLLSPLPFQPLAISIDKSSYTLLLTSGNDVIFKKPIGLGMDDSTPLGSFFVSDRVLSPKGLEPNVFGTAGLGLGKIAIHGTNEDDSIGENYSLGCIRMSNEDINDIYDLVPLGTEVKIVERLLPQEPLQLLSSEVVNNIKPEKQNSVIETTNRIFDWLH